MTEIIKYQDWPESVKITTAYYFKKIFLKTPTISYVVGYLCIALGLIAFIYKVFNGAALLSNSALVDLGYIIIGVTNIIAGNSIKWINKNSSWEERFEHKSNMKHRIIYILVSILLVVCLVGIIYIGKLGKR